MAPEGRQNFGNIGKKQRKVTRTRNFSLFFTYVTKASLNNNLNIAADKC